jgi:hypothetical protein
MSLRIHLLCRGARIASKPRSTVTNHSSRSAVGPSWLSNAQIHNPGKEISGFDTRPRKGSHDLDLADPVGISQLSRLFFQNTPQHSGFSPLNAVAARLPTSPATHQPGPAARRRGRPTHTSDLPRPPPTGHLPPVVTVTTSRTDNNGFTGSGTAPSCIAPAKASTKPGPSGSITSTRSSDTHPAQPTRRRLPPPGRSVSGNSSQNHRRKIIPLSQEQLLRLRPQLEKHAPRSPETVFSLRNAQRRHDGPQCGAIHATSSYGFLLCPELLELGASTGHSTLFLHPSVSQ